MPPRQRAQRTDAVDRMEGFVRLARRTKGGKRHEPNTTDRKEVAKELGISGGTLRSWLSRFPDEWKRARVLAGLDADVATIETDGSGEVKPPAEERVAPGLTVQQAEACRCRILGLMTQRETAERVGVHEDTVQCWGRSPAWRAYAEHLATERHRAVLEAHQETAAIGGQLRVDLLTMARAKLRRAKEMEDTDNVDGLDVEDLAKLAALVDRLTTSAEDRAGYPATSISRLLVTPPAEHSDLDEMSLEDLEAEDRRLAAIEARFTVTAST